MPVGSVISKPLIIPPAPHDTHAAWLALAGVAGKIIQRRLGHASPTTTDRYVKAAESFDREGVGLPFPPIPTDGLVQGLDQK
jgi:integrase